MLRKTKNRIIDETESEKRAKIENPAVGANQQTFAKQQTFANKQKSIQQDYDEVNAKPAFKVWALPPKAPDSKIRKNDEKLKAEQPSLNHAYENAEINHHLHKYLPSTMPEYVFSSTTLSRKDRADFGAYLKMVLPQFNINTIIKIDDDGVDKVVIHFKENREQRNNRLLKNPRGNQPKTLNLDGVLPEIREQLIKLLGSHASTDPKEKENPENVQQPKIAKNDMELKNINPARVGPEILQANHKPKNILATGRTNFHNEKVAYYPPNLNFDLKLNVYNFKQNTVLPKADNLTRYLNNRKANLINYLEPVRGAGFQLDDITRPSLKAKNMLTPDQDVKFGFRIGDII